eukprot:TRINITY_DN5750_c0_g1_i7.p1 TRINITY_DN5750_c0_g1~~TRINITY_DN5750_c0_g1_i7.p1  ORF type:complete len:338 (-),score=-37.11 TRINITY_DN5750_c0_g1_i7:651-1664(-)
MSFVHLQFLNLVMQKILKTICGYFQFNHYEHVISIQVRLLHVCHVFKALSNSNIYASRFGRLNQSINKINILIDQQICTTLKKCKLQYFDICICTIDSYILFCNITYNVTRELYKYLQKLHVFKKFAQFPKNITLIISIQFINSAIQAYQIKIAVIMIQQDQNIGGYKHQNYNVVESPKTIKLQQDPIQNRSTNKGCNNNNNNNTPPFHNKQKQLAFSAWIFVLTKIGTQFWIIQNDYICTLKITKRVSNITIKTLQKQIENPGKYFWFNYYQDYYYHLITDALLHIQLAVYFCVPQIFYNKPIKIYYLVVTQFYITQDDYSITIFINSINIRSPAK